MLNYMQYAPIHLNKELTILDPSIEPCGTPYNLFNKL